MADATKRRAALLEVDIEHNLAEQVYHRRTAKGWTQEELARRAGFHEKQVSHYEAGHRRGGVSVIARFAAALECEPYELLMPWPHPHTESKRED